VVGVFVRLKLRMLKNRLGSSSVLALIGFVLVWVAAIGAGVGVAILVSAGARLLPAIRDDLAVLVLAVTGIGWVVGPVVAASIEDSLDPRKFESLPIGRIRLGVGLAAAGVFGPGGVATTIGLVGGALGGYADLLSAVPITVAALLAVVLAVVTARWLITLLSDLLRSRRTREIAALVVGLTMALPGVLSALVNLGGLRVEASIERLASVAIWLPNGALGAAVVAFADHEWLRGALLVGYGAAALVAVTWAYGRAIDRLQVTVGAGGGREVRTGGSLRPSRIRLPAGAVGAVAAKELIYLRRDSRLRGQMVGSLIGIVVIAGIGFPLLRTEFGPFLAAPMAFFVVIALVVNQFGYDGGSFWGYLTIAPDLVTVLRGKNLAALVFAVPVCTLAAIVGASIAGDWLHVPAAIVSAVAVVGVWSAVGNVTSILGPIQMPESNPFGTRGVSGAAFVASMVGLLAAGALMLPVIGAVGAAAWFGGPGWALAAAVVSVGFAAVVYVVSFRFTGPLMERRMFSVMAVIDAD
jgi:ABC-2 type transport system permease protein